MDSESKCSNINVNSPNFTEQSETRYCLKNIAVAYGLPGPLGHCRCPDTESRHCAVSRRGGSGKVHESGSIVAKRWSPRTDLERHRSKRHGATRHGTPQPHRPHFYLCFRIPHLGFSSNTGSLKNVRRLMKWQRVIPTNDDKFPVEPATSVDYHCPRAGCRKRNRYSMGRLPAHSNPPTLATIRYGTLSRQAVPNEAGAQHDIPT